MKRILVLLLPAMLLLQCNNHEPDVSNIPVHITIRRFDTFLFEKTDTTDIIRGIAGLQSAFPSFSQDFITNILALPPVHLPASDSAAAVTLPELKRFIGLTRPLYDALAPKFRNTEALEQSLTRSFQHVKYYFPDYKAPGIILYVGPFNAPGVAITSDALAIGLQLYAGKDFSFYTSDAGQEMFPAYISRRFEPQYMPVNCMKAVTEDMFPDKSASLPLIMQMIEKGKQWYLLKKFLPDTPDTLITGYTRQQQNWCKENEGVMWNFFLQNNDVYTTEPAIVKDYIGEAPHTEGMPDAAPGNTGQWVGWQIVQKFASGHPEMPPAALMVTDPKKIFSESKYRPR